MYYSSFWISFECQYGGVGALSTDVDCRKWIADGKLQQLNVKREVHSRVHPVPWLQDDNELAVPLGLLSRSVLKDKQMD